MIPKLIVVALTCLLFSSSYSQKIRPKLLLMYDADHVTSYFDSLNHLRYNPYYKVEKDITPSGDLILKNDFAIADEDFYSCTHIETKFQRLKGVDYCVMEIIMASKKDMLFLLEDIKDRYTKIADNKWQFEPPAFPEVRVIATYKQPEDNSEYSFLIYELETK